MKRSKRTLLVLGGSRDQLFLVRTAQSMGLAVLCVDQDPAAPGFQEAEESAPVSTRDVPALLAFLEERRAARGPVAGVMTMGSDIPDVVAALAAELGLPGPSLETGRLATDKHAMKQRFAERGIPIPWFAEVRSSAEVAKHVAERGKLVLKPVDRSGSRGVFVLDGATDPAELADLFRLAREVSLSGRVQVEEYLDGPQLSTETILWDGRALTPGFAIRNYDDLARFQPQVMENGAWVQSHVENGYNPTTLVEVERRSVEWTVVQAARALGIERGTAKGDVVWTRSGPKIIEIAARLSGGDFCESLVPLSTGVNYVRAAIRIALGEEPVWSELVPAPDRPVRHVANRYFFPEPGRVVAIEGEAAVRAQPWVKKLELCVRPGDVVPPATSHATRPGVFVVVADDRVALERRIAWVYGTLRLVTEPVRAALRA